MQTSFPSASHGLLRFLFGMAILAMASPASHGKTAVEAPTLNELSILHFRPHAVPEAELDQKVPILATVAYALDAADSATIQLEMSTADDPTRFVPVAEGEVKRGRGTVALSGWGTLQKRGEARPYMLQARFVPILRDRNGDEIISRPRPIVIGRVSEEHIDGLTILGCEPERLKLDREQEVSVLIAYDLKTVDRGEINLGFNVDHSTTHTMAFGSKTVDRGSGQIVLTARVKPRSWGEKVFFNALVILSEDPHTERWTPLASDSEPIELNTR